MIESFSSAIEYHFSEIVGLEYINAVESLAIKFNDQFIKEGSKEYGKIISREFM